MGNNEGDIGEESTEGHRPLVVLPDANVLVHGKHIGELPWHELGRPVIEVATVGPVVRELDGLKNKPGRAGKVARELSSRLRVILEAPGREVVIRGGEPRVVQRIRIGGEPVGPVRPGLRLDHVDQSIINFGLALADRGEDVLLLTDDTICGATADEFGLPMLFLPEHWRRGEEPDEQAKENAKLKAENARLRDARPRPELAFHDEAGKPLKGLNAAVVRWPALEESDIEELLEAVRDACPAATSFERAPDRTRPSDAAASRYSYVGMTRPGRVYEPATEAEITRYRDRSYPEWLEAVRGRLATLHVALNAREFWPSAFAVARNAGSRPALGTLLRMTALGDIAIRSLDDEEDEAEKRAKAGRIEPDGPPTLPPPPLPPRGRMRETSLAGGILGRMQSGHATIFHTPFELPPIEPPQPRRDDSFYWREGRRDVVEVMELECASWRHDEDARLFGMRLTGPTDTNLIAGAIELKVSAANLTEGSTLTLPLRISVEPGLTRDVATAMVEALARRPASFGTG